MKSAGKEQAVKDGRVKIIDVKRQASERRREERRVENRKLAEQLADALRPKADAKKVADGQQAALKQHGRVPSILTEPTIDVRAQAAKEANVGERTEGER